MTNVTETDFAFVADLAKSRSGLTLTPDKLYLVESRLGPVARRVGFATVKDAIAAARTRRDPALIDAFVDALTTNETFFFRDKTPFEILRDHVLPGLIERRGAGARLRIWCAACSTGQEPYSVAMTVLERRAKGERLDVEILATDLSDRVLEKAREARFSQFEVQRGLPINNLVKYFEKADDQWLLKPEVKSMVRFTRQNLMDDLRGLGRFDIVFCRNVLIYFDAALKRKVLENIAGVMAVDGALFLGAAETVLGITEAFTPSPEKRGVYVRNPAWRPARAA